MIKQYIKNRINRYLKKYLVQVFGEIKQDFENRELEKLKVQFKSIGENCTIAQRNIIVNSKYITIGNNFYSLANLRLEAWDYYEGKEFQPEIVIGDNVKMNTDIHIGAINKVIIGDNVMFASRIYISDHSHGEITSEALKTVPAKRPLISKGPVLIEDNVWIGEGVAILPNVVIGENSIIGANSVVTKSFPANSVIAGCPAKLIRRL